MRRIGRAPVAARRGLAAGLLDHPVAEQAISPCCSASGMKSPEAPAARAVLPAHERLHPDHRPALELDERLIVEHEPVATLDASCAAGWPSRSPRAPCRCRAYSAWPSRPPSFTVYIAKSACLSNVMRRRRGWVEADADAGADVDLHPLDEEWQPQAPRTISASLSVSDDVTAAQRSLALEVGEQDQELVTALARHDIRRATASRRRVPTARSSSSPAVWPKLSLTSLKLSRSMGAPPSPSP